MVMIFIFDCVTLQTSHTMRSILDISASLNATVTLNTLYPEPLKISRPLSVISRIGKRAEEAGVNSLQHNNLEMVLCNW